MKLELKMNQRVRNIVFAYLQIVLGCIIGGMAYPLFLTPNGIAPGGLTGVGIIFNHLFGWPVGVVSLVLNVPLFLLSFRQMGPVFAFRSLVAMVLFSLAIDLIPLGAMTQDALLGTLFGGIVLGVGLGLIMRGGATTGGTDMLARLIHRHLSYVSVGVCLFVLDCVVIVAAGIFIGANEALYAIIDCYVSSKVIDMVLIGLTANKACFIISGAWEKISDRILHDMERGATLLKAKGAWSRKDNPVLMSVVARNELSTIKRIVEEEDPSAFMFVTEAYEALGEGFSSLTQEN
ncbi:MAG: YitT family protein [Clostridia bacterium]|nr:YitT family protein [Clostridia bacterium]MBR2287512.1 YitT family protein [Clostridia bacterium]